MGVPGLKAMSNRSNRATFGVLPRLGCLLLAVVLMVNAVAPVSACGPFFIEPVFVSTSSPDLPFTQFTNGNLGIIKPSFGRKTLTIAFRYLNGGSFTADEQKVLVRALHAKSLEEPASDPVKTWIAARKEFLSENEQLPAIYVEKRYEGYDFFPNCTPNAFEVATETLRARVASYGVEDKDVRAWLTAQDTVFQNCATAGRFPEPLGNESVEWLRRDRDYQIAAAHFYSLNFEKARSLFTAISHDPASPWQETADYLVGRNLVRQASLTRDETQRNELYRQAELYLQALQLRTIKFARATQRLLALVKFRIHPEERVRELARVLAYQNGNENLGQDLIDYVWLVDKFEAETLEEIEKRKNPKKEGVDPEDFGFSRERSEALNAGEIFSITIDPKLKEEDTPDYSRIFILDFDKDATESDVIHGFAQRLGRSLTEAELKQVKERYTLAMNYRNYLISPNRKIADSPHNRYKGCDYYCDRLAINAIPEILRADELTDWILTLQTDDPASYSHALAQWRETKSDAWLAVVLMKAQRITPRLAPVLRRAEQIERDSPAFATVAFHLIRLRIAMGQQRQALAMLEDILSWQSDVLPLSAQNQFIEQRMRLSKTLDEFLRFSARRPSIFNFDGRMGSIHDLMEKAKADWSPEFPETKEENERRVEQYYRPFLPWDTQSNFDNATVDVLNWHFPLSVMAEASGNAALPDHLRRRLLLTVWTRAIVLKQPAIAERFAPQVLKLAPELAPVMQSYLDARTSQERNHAALFVLLKFPSLSPLLREGVPEFVNVEDSEYYLQDAWWCAPSDTEYTMKGEEVTKVVPKPLFLSATQLETAHRERAALVTLGDAKSYLAKQTLAWARSAPQDPRVPEALYIAVQATSTYKYGCSGWEYDRVTKKQAETILRTRYPQSPWTAKLTELEQ